MAECSIYTACDVPLSLLQAEALTSASGSFSRLAKAWTRLVLVRFAPTAVCSCIYVVGRRRRRRRRGGEKREIIRCWNCHVY